MNQKQTLSIARIRERYGVSERTAYRWIADNDSRAFASSPRTSKEKKGTLDPRVEHGLWKRAQREREELALEIDRGRFVPLDEVSRGVFRYVGAIKGKLLGLETNVTITAAAEFKLTDEQQSRLREIVRTEAEQVLDSLHNGDWLLTPYACPHCRAVITPADKQEITNETT